MILNAVEGKPLPIYGDGGNVRDWIYVDDHCRGAPGGKYNLGGASERTNLAVSLSLRCLLTRGPKVPALGHDIPVEAAG